MRASGAHLGAVIDADGEHLTLVDDEGTCSPTTRPSWPCCAWRCETRKDARVALPVAVGRAAEADRAAEANVPVICTKLSTPHLMEVASQGGVTFAASQDGGFICRPSCRPTTRPPPWWRCWPCSSETDQRLSKLVHALPPSTSPTRRW